MQPSYSNRGSFLINNAVFVLLAAYLCAVACTLVT